MTLARRDAKSHYLPLLLATLRDRLGNHGWQLIVSMRLTELSSPTHNGLGVGGAHSSLENSLDLSMM
jgi:hypothetical protein